MASTSLASCNLLPVVSYVLERIVAQNEQVRLGPDGCGRCSHQNSLLHVLLTCWRVCCVVSDQASQRAQRLPCRQGSLDLAAGVPPAVRVRARRRASLLLSMPSMSLLILELFSASPLVWVGSLARPNAASCVTSSAVTRFSFRASSTLTSLFSAAVSRSHRCAFIVSCSQGMIRLPILSLSLSLSR